MSTAPEGLEFSTVIASTVHDMKNSLALLTQTHSQWLTQLPEALLHNREHGIIEYEFARLNGMLVQMLGLYKLGVNQLPLRPARARSNTEKSATDVLPHTRRRQLSGSVLRHP